MPTLGANTVTIHRGRVLLIRRADLPVWCLPGGAVDPGEMLEAAAVRETLEETSVEVELTRLVGVYSRPHWTRGGDHEAVFAASPRNGLPAVRDGEASDVRYFSRNAMPESLVAWHRRCIDDAFEGKSGLTTHSQLRWPFPDMTLQQLRDEYRAGRLSEAAVLQAFCRRAQ